MRRACARSGENVAIDYHSLRGRRVATSRPPVLPGEWVMVLRWDRAKKPCALACRTAMNRALGPADPRWKPLRNRGF